MQHPERQWRMGLRESRERGVVCLIRAGRELGGALLCLARHAGRVDSLRVVIVLAGFSLYPYMA